LSSEDKSFTDLFALIIGMLVAVSFGLFLVARYISGQTQEIFNLEDPAYQSQVEDRVRPIGQVAVVGDETPATEKTPVETVEPVEAAMTGPQVYNTACLACHGAGIGGAPKVGDAAAWADRIGQGADTLNDHAINGYQGSAGYMPPKGGRVDLSDQEIIDAVAYMVEQSS